MIDWLSLAIVLVLCLVLGVLSFRFNLLTASGSITAFVLGMMIGGFGSIGWLLILVFFTVFGFIVTRYRIKEKTEMGLQEGKKGERTHRNVLANAFVPAIVAILAWALQMQHEAIPAIVYLSSISVAASDTVASEMGILSSKVRLITTMERVEPGTDGGISTYGTAWAFMGAVGASIFGWIVLFPDDLLNPLVLVPIIIGFIGCNIDSLVGATLERGGYIGKLGTNMISMAMGALLALVILLLMI
jgi:uncharacterized protein (TIGR00297 family)